MSSMKKIYVLNFRVQIIWVYSTYFVVVSVHFKEMNVSANISFLSQYKNYTWMEWNGYLLVYFFVSNSIYVC